LFFSTLFCYYICVILIDYELLPYYIKMKKMQKLALIFSGLLLCNQIFAEESENTVLTAVSGTTISGYVETSMNWQFGDKKTSAGRTTDNANNQNGFNFSEIQLAIQREVDRDAGDWDAGYKFSTLMVPYDGGAELLLQNAYVDILTPIGNGLVFTVGAFESLLGYEATEKHENPCFTHSYGASIVHSNSTGALANYEFDINGWILGLTGGIANTYASFGINDRSSDSVRLSYTGVISLTFPESTGFLEGTELFFGVVNGVNTVVNGPDTKTRIIPSTVSYSAYAKQSSPNTVDYSAYAKIPLPIDKLSFVAAYEYIAQATRHDLEHAWAQAIAGYLIYDFTESFTLANRFEYANGTPDYFADTTRVVWKGDEAADFIADTFTVTYKLTENVLTRAEFRWDQDITHNGRMVDDGTQNNAYGITGNITYIF